jgi:hypothetical protein
MPYKIFHFENEVCFYFSFPHIYIYSIFYLKIRKKDDSKFFFSSLMENFNSLKKKVLFFFSNNKKIYHQVVLGDEKN